MPRKATTCNTELIQYTCDTNKASKGFFVKEFLKKEEKDDTTLKRNLENLNLPTKKESININKKKKEIHKDSKENLEIKKKEFLKIPLTYHTNFIGTIAFIIGSIFFLIPILYVSGCLTFAIACLLCLYSNWINTTNIKTERNNEYYGFVSYIIGCLIFTIGSIYSCFIDDYYGIGSFIIGSLFFLIGSILFFFTINIKKIKYVDYKILIVFISNFIGSVLFTLGSVFFIYNNLYNLACYLFIIGSTLFTLATWFDYVIYMKDAS